MEFLKFNQRHLATEILFCASMGNLKAGAEVQADCMCVVYLRVPVCVTEGGGTISTLSWGGGASSTLVLESTRVSKLDCEKGCTVLST